MPSLIVTANTTAQQIAAERRDAVYKPTSIQIDNSAGGGARVIRLQDIFTPNITDGVSSPTLQTVDRWRGEVLIGENLNFDEAALRGIKILGALNVISDVTDANCHIGIGFEHVKG